MVPPLYGADDFIRVGGPDEGFGIIVGLVDEAVDGGLEVGDGAEHATLETAPGKLGEKALGGVQPGAGGGRHYNRNWTNGLVPHTILGCI